MPKHFVTVNVRETKVKDIDAYLGFGAEIIETGKNKFGDSSVIIGIEHNNSRWMEGRLCSGNFGARISDTPETLEAWKEEWGFVSEWVKADRIELVNTALEKLGLLVDSLPCCNEFDRWNERLALLDEDLRIWGGIQSDAA